MKNLKKAPHPHTERNAQVHYDIHLDQAHAHVIRVVLSIEEPLANQRLELPVWIPGSYLVREFSKDLLDIKATQNKRTQKIEQLNKNTWQVASKPGSMLQIQYHVYAHDASVRTAWLDLDRGFFNGSSVFLKVLGEPNNKDFNPEPLTVRVHAPTFNRSWRLATSLPMIKEDRHGFGLFQARDYEHLIDCPVEMGEFWLGQFISHGVRHRVVVAGASSTFDGERLLKDVQRICQYQIEFWHPHSKPVIDEYLFILWAVGEGYGGLEHQNSTALIANRQDLPRLGQTGMGDGYIQLLGLFSHEYFHTWNIKRLKPTEFLKLDLNQENYTKMLWFFEGFTSYYDDLVLVRSGLIEVTDYLKLLTKTLNQVLQTPGRLKHSAAQASFEAWTKYYRPQPSTANTTVSYYTKGALIALCLDLSLRQGVTSESISIKSSNQSTPSKNTRERSTQLESKPSNVKTLSKPRPLSANLDSVMRTLWEKCQHTGMSEEDLLSVLKELTSRDWSTEIQSWVHGTEDLPVVSLLEHHGVQARLEPAQWAQRLGLRIQETNNIITVKQVLAGGLAEKAGFCPQDEWLGIEVPAKRSETSQSWRLYKLEEWPQYVGQDKSVIALIARDKKILKLKLSLKGMDEIKTYRLTPQSMPEIKSWLQ